MSKFILSIDEGTTATTAMVVQSDLTVIGKASNEIPQIYPQPGWVEHAPEAIWASTESSCRHAMEVAGVSPSDCIAVAISNQRETTMLWDRIGGRSRYNAIVWQCRRTAPFCDELKAQGHEPLFKQRTGLVLDPYFSGTKIRWMLDNVPGLRADVDAGKVAFGTVDSFLAYRLSGGVAHVTDVSNASRTLCMNLSTLDWDPELMDILGVPKSLMPKIMPSAGVFGVTKGLSFLPDGIPISGIAGDQQSALFGQTCFNVGQSKCTYGTGAFLLMNTGEQIPVSEHGLLTTVGWTVDGKTCYALEGIAFIAGAAVQWLRDGLGLIRTAPERESLASQVPDSGGVVFVPALAGLGAPYWRADARGVLVGLTRGTTAAHIVRDVLEGIAFEVADLVDAMGKDLGSPITELRVDGGASANNLLMQFQSDILGVPVLRPANVDTTAMGASMLAGIGIGLWDMDALTKLCEIERSFKPKFSEVMRQQRIAGYRRAVSKA